MTVETEFPLVPYPILEAIPNEGILYSTLLNMTSLLERYGDVNTLANEIHKIIPLDLVSIIPDYDENGDEDYRISLTDRGKSILKNPHE